MYSRDEVHRSVVTLVKWATGNNTPYELSLAEILQDLLCHLTHLCGAKDIDFRQVVGLARVEFEDDQMEEARASGRVAR